MGTAEQDSLNPRKGALRRWLGRTALAVAALALLGIGYLWATRDRIAGDLIDGYLADSGLEASYRIISIGLRQQIIEDVVIGDPASPDLTIERVIATISYGWGTPSISALVIERPRLKGSYRGGTLSFGALDAVLFAPSDQPPGLPAMEVKLIDGGAVIDSDYGALAAHLEGEGRLDDGFAGTLAITAPAAGVEGCKAQRATAYGSLSVSDGAPRFAGPVRLRDVMCAGAQLASADIAAVLTSDSGFSTLKGQFELVTGKVLVGENSAGAITGRANASLSADRLMLDHDLSLERIDLPYAAIARLGLDGTLRSGADFARASWNARIEGGGVDLAQASTAALDDARRASAGTLIAPLLGKLERNFARAARAATLEGDVSWRIENAMHSVVIPEARLRSATGETLLAVSRASWSQSAKTGSGRLSGNFMTGGEGLPRITGRMEQAAGGALALRMTMADYSAGQDRIALPRLSLRQDASGAFTFAGSVTASGAIPGGVVRGLTLPLNGRFDARNGLAMGADCETVRFAAARYYDMSLSERAFTLCPGREGQPMVRYRDALSLALVSEDLVLEGDFAGTPSRFATARAALIYGGNASREAPGGFELLDFEAVIGSAGNALTLATAALEGTFDPASLDSPLGGGFSGGTARLDAVPLDLSELSGRWSYAGNTLSVAEAQFTLTERTSEDAPARFEPLAAREATLTLAGNDITALARLQHPASAARIVDVLVRHDLASAQGSAILDVAGVTFGPGFELHDLTYLAKGVVANTRGTVRGTGRIAWTGDEVTSTGTFCSDGLDLAAAFGPVRGLRGELRFSDLLSMTTEPSQMVTIDSINPGIEAIAGKVRFTLTDAQTIDLEDARWPFMGGTLVMQPTTLRYGLNTEQRYTFTVTGLDAAKFIAQMELTNLAATGTFDGQVPITFDADGNGRIEEGSLVSRAPGGSLSYIGELTYEDMGAMSNFAFQALRSLDYRAMVVGLDGDLAGEIITRFRIDGVRQGVDASQNVITRRLARLPIRFIVNVRSDNFYELATMVRTFWDPDALPDAIDQGVIPTPRDRPIVPLPETPAPPADPQNPAAPAIRPDEPPVQPPESDIVR